MANTIELAKNYLDIIDEVYKLSLIHIYVERPADSGN